MSCWLDWIDKHEVVSNAIITLFITAISALVWWAYTWHSNSIRLRLILSEWSLKSTNTLKGELKYHKIGLRVMIAKDNDIPSWVSEFYLELPSELSKNAEFKKRFPQLIRDKSEVRIYQNNFRIGSEDKSILKEVPFELEPVQYLHGDLSHYELNDFLIYKQVTFVLIDHKGGKHSSNPHRIDPLNVGDPGPEEKV